MEWIELCQEESVETADEVADHTAVSGRSCPLTKSLTGPTGISASAPKAVVQSVRVGIEPNVRFWPKADIQQASNV